jgi:hypothetical protein
MIMQKQNGTTIKYVQSIIRINFPANRLTRYSRIVKGICGLLPITVYAPTTDTL